MEDIYYLITLKEIPKKRSFEKRKEQLEKLLDGSGVYFKLIGTTNKGIFDETYYYLANLDEPTKTKLIESKLVDFIDRLENEYTL